MATSTDKHFLHGMGARLVALILGVGIFAFMYTTWGEDMQELAASFSGETTSEPVIKPVGVERVSEENAALSACLEERVGHVDQMLADGVISEDQHGQFKLRATSLCQVQNPS